MHRDTPLVRDQIQHVVGDNNGLGDTPETSSEDSKRDRKHQSHAR